MGIPGPIDTINGKIIVSTNLPKLIGFPIAEYIENHFHKPTYMDNDVKVAALGEAVQGAGKDYPIVYYVTISTGVGGALVIDQKELLSQEKVKLYSEIRSITRAMYLILPAQETSRLSKL